MKRAAVKALRPVRPAAQAGRFYPADPAQLRRAVESLLAAVPASDAPSPRAIIAPHAGYVYSGPIAATAFARLRPLRDQIRRVVLMGPAHYVPITGIAVSGAGAFATPLGEVPLDGDACARAASMPGAYVDDAPHAPEHSLEVELPFLQSVLGEFTLVPLLVGDTEPADAAAALAALSEAAGTLIVVSSDLSHFHNYETARQLDDATAETITQLRAEELDGSRACGHVAIAGLLLLARQRGWRVSLEDLRNSGDTAGTRDRVVGYGAFSVR